LTCEVCRGEAVARKGMAKGGTRKPRCNPWKGTSLQGRRFPLGGPGGRIETASAASTRSPAWPVSPSGDRGGGVKVRPRRRLPPGGRVCPSGERGGGLKLGEESCGGGGLCDGFPLGGPGGRIETKRCTSSAPGRRRFPPRGTGGAD